MKNKPTLFIHKQSATYQLEMKRYQAMVADIQTYLNSFPSILQTQSLASFNPLAEGEFSQVVALLPYWLSDLLPVSEEIQHQLGVAHLYGWWYYYLQDELLDGDKSSMVILPAHLALVKMIEIYAELGLTQSPCWAEFERLSINSAAMYHTEISTHFTELTQLTPERVAVWTPELIIERASPFFFNTIAQAYLAAYTLDDPLPKHLVAALQAFTVVRQITDDATDWMESLHNGQLNYVSACLIKRIYDLEEIDDINLSLSPDRLIGYQLSDEIFWAEMEKTSQHYATEALRQLAAYPNCKLTTLVKRQQTLNAEYWAASRTYRATLREMFGLDDGQIE